MNFLFITFRAGQSDFVLPEPVRSREKPLMPSFIGEMLSRYDQTDHTVGRCLEASSSF